MKHARQDYDRIQDPAGLIPQDEPVFLLRAQDRLAPAVIRQWANNAMANGVARPMVDAALDQAKAMEDWQKKHGYKMPDLPPVLGYCPQCGAPGETREKRPGGNDVCVNGHSYPSTTALAVAPAPPSTSMK